MNRPDLLGSAMMEEKYEVFYSLLAGHIGDLCFDENALRTQPEVNLIDAWLVQHGLGKAALRDWFDPEKPHGPS